jgi:dTDP-4-dehydrorhamnose reductase
MNLQLWGGVECTINRVGEEYLEQLGRTGHVSRASDFRRFAELGIQALRHPILWECHPAGPESENWKWAETSLRQLSELGIRPIVGLVHHGSGPRHTNLLDPNFAAEVARYAEQVATRFPEIQDYTPINEPLTTARFSALYGHWYPHHRDEYSFACAFLNECRAVVLSMEAIRRINPSARLIQTEDLGKVYSTPVLSYQAEFENERRWCTYDLLCGRVNRHHRMWDHFRWAGIDASELQWFLDHPCPPDIIGINHYLSGERYLDENIERYPADSHGGNGQHAYADVLAARVLRQGTLGPGALMMEAWNRYKLPIAVTECHNGCTREEQLRWFLEVWRGAQNAVEQGANVVAVTAWSLLGAFDWNHLMTRKDDHYEPGVYDIRSSPPRPTALAGLLTSLSADKELTHPLLDVPGWWRRQAGRFIYGFCAEEDGVAKTPEAWPINRSYAEVRPVIITGGNGTLARAFGRVCEIRGIPYRLLSRRSLDIADAAAVRQAFHDLHPWAVINTAGYVRVDEAELDADRCFRENTLGAHVLARECVQRNISLLTFSSDLVFDGEKDSPYTESDTAAPMNVYGASKLLAEKLVAEAMPSALIIRCSAFFGPWDDANFVVSALRALTADEDFKAPADVIVSPTYVPDLVNTSLDLLIDGERGIWHLANVGETSWADLAETAACMAGVPIHKLQPCTLDDLQLPARRPFFSALASERAILMPTLASAMDRFFRDCETNWRSADELSKNLAA